ncbi:hypothetical protein BDV38DRAFT_282822 [Aspergillus pseudotamarii]|uniref:F-box domain-containing protein n=1 Tax=Aspergillus pseudotamarii TaxID=132259 RepID=A0A5N6SWR2_ASPPS|nr:uncharacterized protein BDV38DRAFT_282822 [Aspergillus pseudotamarii]KAE8137574.1 hypothetical protein BDV38DRAFT_282822 [Aspergillus pseudotamarii]
MTSSVNNLAEASSAYAGFRINTDLNQHSDDDDEFLSSASTTSEGVQEHLLEYKQPALESMNCQQGTLCDPTAISSSNSLRAQEVERSGVEPVENNFVRDGKALEVSRRPLHLLDLPMDILQVIIKEVTHTNDLTSLALTCSSLHALAIPQMYSRFDIVWPEPMSPSVHPTGVDALSYGLATLVMGEDVFHELPPPHRPVAPCHHCGCSAQHVQHGPRLEADGIRRIRRGNHYAQYTRKFSVGNGPPECVQEYSVTKETGKMLGTLVALAIARMINLESFIWDMPTGVLRDVWIALSSLADRPGHDCRLERVWVRWHDNSMIRIVRTPSDMTLPGMPSPFISPSARSTRLQNYAHVEYPTLSILPPLKSLSVLDIDESSYIEEMAVLIERSRGRLKELRIGISSRVYQYNWLKALGGWSPVQQDASNPVVSGWPKVGGVLGVLLGNPHTQFPFELAADQPSSKEVQPGQHGSHQGLSGTVPPAGDIASNGTSNGHSTTQLPDTAPLEHSPKTTGASRIDSVTSPQVTEEPYPTQPPRPGDLPEPSSKRVGINKPFASASATSPKSDRLKLEVLELERVSLSIPVMMHAIDWTRITTLTILRCDGHEKLWRALRRQFSPSAALRGSPKPENKDINSSSSEYSLKLKHIHTDAVSPYLLLFIKDAIAPNTLETLFLHEAPMYDSIVHVDAIYRNVIRNHRTSLKHILVDSTERSPGGIEISTNRWRKWMFTREMISFITSGRMPRLRELSMTMHSKDWHYFLQRLPNMPQLRALHIPHITNPIHRDPKELALQILDIITIRTEVGISYIGMINKCYEILEGKRGEKDDFDDADDSPSEGFVPGSDDWAPSDTDDDDSDDGGAGSAIESNSELSSDDHSSSDGYDSDLESSKSRVAFRLREILFYDDKISIFKARHGVL